MANVVDITLKARDETAGAFNAVNSRAKKLGASSASASAGMKDLSTKTRDTTAAIGGMNTMAAGNISGLFTMGQYATGAGAAVAKLGAIGAAAFAGWKTGLRIREIAGIGEALDKLVANRFFDGSTKKSLAEDQFAGKAITAANDTKVSDLKKNIADAMKELDRGRESTIQFGSAIENLKEELEIIGSKDPKTVRLYRREIEALTEAQEKLNDQISDKQKSFDVANSAANAAHEMQMFTEQADDANETLTKMQGVMDNIADPRLRKNAIANMGRGGADEVAAGEKARLDIIDKIAADRKRQRDPEAKRQMRDQERERRRIENRFEQAQAKVARGVKLSKEDNELIALMGGANKAGVAGNALAIAQDNMTERKRNQSFDNVKKIREDVGKLADELGRLLRAAG